MTNHTKSDNTNRSDQTKSAACVVGSLLTEGEERLLVRFFDGEHSMLDAVRVTMLRRRKSAAKDFLSTLTTIRAIAQNKELGVLATDPRPVNLWDRIEARIDAEERAAVYLGAREGQQRVTYRQHDDKREQKRGPLFGISLGNVVWGGCSACAAACLTVVVMHGTNAPLNGEGTDSFAQLAPAQNKSVRAVAYSRRRHQGGEVLRRFAESDIFNEQTAGQVPERTAVASLGGMRAGGDEFGNVDEFPSDAVEVNWMRSSGRVRLMQDPEDRSAIIWVRRPQVALADEFMPGDEPSQGGANKPLIVYGERAAQGIPVSNDRYSR